MNRANVVPIGEKELAKENARSDALLELDAEAWAAACAADVADYTPPWRSHWHTAAPGADD